jgi:hypothetical protein
MVQSQSRLIVTGGKANAPSLAIFKPTLPESCMVNTSWPSPAVTLLPGEERSIDFNSNTTVQTLLLLLD